MQNYLISCYKRKDRYKDNDKTKFQSPNIKGKTDWKPIHIYIRELLEKAFLCLTVLLTAVAVSAIDNYSCMYDFVMMTVRALQAAGG